MHRVARWTSLVNAALLATGACRYTPMRQVEGRWVYAVECENTFAPCRARASELCPGGYDTLESKKEPRDDRRERGHGQLPPRFFLEITCRDDR